MSKKDQVVYNRSRGEKSAMTGYLKQYEFLACKILKSMETDRFEGIRVLDPSAGILDDVVIQETDCIHAFQIKTSSVDSGFRIGTELYPELKNLADSWRMISNGHTKSLIKCTYIFSGYPSTSDNLCKGKTKTDVLTSADFIKLFNDKTTPAVSTNKNGWPDLLSSLGKKSGCEGNEKTDFFKSLFLSSKSEIDLNRFSGLSIQQRKLATKIRDIMPGIVAAKKSKVFWSEAELLKEIGSVRSLSGRFIHEFPTKDDDQSIKVTAQSLMSKIKNTESGYLSLTGPPGTGKSTLLSREIRSEPNLRVVRYLAFLPDTRHGLGRSEATSFLNDIVSQLVRGGLNGPDYVVEI